MGVEIDPNKKPKDPFSVQMRLFFGVSSRSRRDFVIPYTKQQYIYHYTDLNAFKSIITTKNFWATNIKYLNDKSEQDYALDEIERKIEEIFQYNNYNPAFEKLIKNSFEYKGIENNRFLYNITSFSFSNDNLALWRSYGGRQGISLELDMSMVDREQCGGIYYDVFYGLTPEMENLIRSRINLLYRFFKNQNNKLGFTPITIEMFFFMFVQFLSVRCKHPSFEYENEVRMVSFYDQQIHFRTTNSLLIPYVEAQIKDIGNKNLLPLKSITIGPGPSENSELLKRSIEVFLEEQGYLNIPVNISEIPYREIR